MAAPQNIVVVYKPKPRGTPPETIARFESELDTKRVCLYMDHLVHRNAQRITNLANKCLNVKCEELDVKLKCLTCHGHYCSRSCQKEDWESHKQYCVNMKNFYDTFMESISKTNEGKESKGIVMTWGKFEGPNGNYPLSVNNDENKELMVKPKMGSGHLIFDLQGFTFCNPKCSLPSLDLVFGGKLKLDDDYHGRLPSGKSVLNIFGIGLMRDYCNAGIVIKKKALKPWNLVKSILVLLLLNNVRKTFKDHNVAPSPEIMGEKERQCLQEDGLLDQMRYVAYDMGDDDDE